jgi:hypothetical protein
MKERDAWWLFLTGQPESEWNPPKKPKKQNKRDQRYGNYGGGMRGFPLEYEVHYTSASDPLYASEEGEVERAITVDVIDLLPTPSTTPAPSETTLQVDDDGTPQGSGSTATSASVLPPEPTPLLLRNLDHVSARLIFADRAQRSYCALSAIFTASSDVLRSLD